MIKQQESFDEVRKSNFKDVVSEIKRLIPDYQSSSLDFQELYDLSQRYRRGVSKKVCSNNVDLSPKDVFPAIDMAFYKAVKDFNFSKGTNFATWFRGKVRGEISHIRAFRDGNTKKYKKNKSLDSTNRNEKKRLEGMFHEATFVKNILDSEHIKNYMPLIFEDLSQRDRLIVYMRYGCGLSLSRIEKKIGIHKTNVGKRLTSFINPVLSEKIERFEIPYNPRVFMRAVRNYYHSSGSLY